MIQRQVTRFAKLRERHQKLEASANRMSSELHVHALPVDSKLVMAQPLSNAAHKSSLSPGPHGSPRTVAKLSYLEAQVERLDTEKNQMAQHLERCQVLKAASERELQQIEQDFVELLRHLGELAPSAELTPSWPAPASPDSAITTKILEKFGFGAPEAQDLSTCDCEMDTMYKEKAVVASKIGSLAYIGDQVEDSRDLARERRGVNNHSSEPSRSCAQKCVVM